MSYISSRIHNNNEVLVWERCPITYERIIKSYEAPYYFYVDDPEGTIQTIYDTSVSKLSFKDSKTSWKAKQECNNSKIRMWESDIGPELRVLSNEYYKVPAPKLNITHLDIEVDYDEKRGFSSPKDPYAPINSIALHHEHKREMVVIVVPHPEDPIKWTKESLEKACNDILEIPTDEYSMTFHVVDSEKELLLQFLDEIEDSDLLSTWNGERFDYPYLAGRIQMILGEYHFGRLSFPEGDLPVLEEKIIKPKGEDNNSEQKFQDSYMELRTSGRLLADYMLLYKKYEMSEKPSYKLSAISDDVLVDDNEEPILPKLEYEGTLFGLYRTNLPFFVRYNIRDTEILHGFEKVLGYIEVANQNYHLSCGQFTHVLGTLKLAELAIVNHCHHELKKVVNTTTFPEIDRSIEGALVLLPQVGLQELLGSIDMTSLYPTCIRLLNASPETMIGQFIEEFTTPDLLAKCDDRPLTIKLMDKTRVTKTSQEWNEILRENNWSVSGYGTVFDQTKEGVIPAILTYWFNMRIEYKNHMKTAGKYMAKILSESDGTGEYPRGDKGILLNVEQAKQYDEQKQLYEYNDRLQYVYKIKLNSLYGALSNQWFRFYRLELAESTTSTGRMMLKHQCRKVNELLEGNYNIDFPTYLDPDDAIESGHPATTALHGPKFNGKYQTETVVYGDSVTGDTIIDTERGRQTISSLFTHVSHTIGDKEYCILSTNTNNYHSSLTYDTQNNITTYKPIKYVMRHKCSKQLYRVWITNSQWVDVTEDHSLIGYVNTSKRHKYQNIIAEVKPQELGQDIKSLIYVKQKPYHNYTEQGLSSEMYTFIGLILGDGYVDTTQTGGVLLSIGSKHIPDIEHNVLIPLRDQGWISSWVLKPNNHDIQISSSKLRKFLRQEMYSTGVKSIPNWMESESLLNIASFLKGWFSADGFINTNFTVGLCSINEDHIKKAQELLFKCGVSSTWFSELTENSYRGKYSNTFTKRLTIKSTTTFCEVIGFVLSDKQSKLEKYEEGRTKNALSKYDFEIVRPIKIEKLPTTNDYVYDIEVADTHTFFANNILVHNTDSTYFKTHAETIEDAIKIADLVADAVNKSFPEYIQRMFFTNDANKELLKTAREIVSDRGIFVEKKRYILHIADSEGKRVDKMKIMGLDTKKTTLPAHVSKKLNKFIERLLKGETWGEISESVVEYKEALINAKNVMDIGLPKGVKKVEQYTEDYKYNHKTRLPGHVAGAIFYNQCLEEFDDRINIPITSGMKIKVFRLKGIHNGRFKCISIPTDADFVPDWFLENYVIDKPSHIERLVDNPLQNILKAINEVPPSRDSLIFESAWEF